MATARGINSEKDEFHSGKSIVAAHLLATEVWEPSGDHERPCRPRSVLRSAIKKKPKRLSGSDELADSTAKGVAPLSLDIQRSVVSTPAVPAARIW